MARHARVVVDHVWKKFRGGERQDSLRDLIPAITSRMLGRGKPSAELGERDFWALQDVAFEVYDGEALGIIGPNGAGKSTMLKVLNRILRPTRGRVIVRGRAAALIEVAAGFHPDLTGRENVFLQGAIMGMRREEMRRKLDSIIDFAGVERFIDTPVKRYSNGMNARLGFAIAAHLEPDVLLIDEVLSVGDMAFQEKCVVRMKEFKRNGVAIVFISHNMQAVSDLCDRAIHLKSSVRAEGSVSDVIGSYLLTAQTSADSGIEQEISITRVDLQTLDGVTVLDAPPGTPLRVWVDYRVNAPIEDVHFGLILQRSTDALVVYDAGFHGHELGFERFEPGQTFRIAYDVTANVTRGQYHFHCHVFHNATSRFVARANPAAHLRVDEVRTYAGIADLDARATVYHSTSNSHPSSGAANAVATFG